MLSRRSFISLTACFTAAQLPVLAALPDKDDEVSAIEDLMLEHGVLNRLLLIYDHAEVVLSGNHKLPMNSLHDAASTIQNFVENYHGTLEEAYLFPRFEKAGKYTDLVSTLKSQHYVGRNLTDEIVQLTVIKSPNQSEKKRLLDNLSAFVRMFRPHEAYEDTVLFPALRQITSKHELDSLAEVFERQGREVFGSDGYDGVISRVAEIEKCMGIHDLSQFTADLT